jgi:hypothetical protein
MVPVREPVIVSVREPVIVPVREPVIVPALEPVIVPAYEALTSEQVKTAAVRVRLNRFISILLVIDHLLGADGAFTWRFHPICGSR